MIPNDENVNNAGKPEGKKGENDELYENEDTTRPEKDDSERNYSEQNDVTPPKPHDFPSVGHAKTNFESRPHGRTTGRMTGHEPGTEGI